MDYQSNEQMPQANQVDTFTMVLGLAYCVLTAVMWWYTCEDKCQPLSGLKV